MKYDTGKGLAATVWIFGIVGSIGYGAQKGSIWLTLLGIGFFVALGAVVWILDKRRPAEAEEPVDERTEKGEEEPPAPKETEPKAEDIVEEGEDEEEELIHPISAKIFVKPAGDFVVCPHCGQRQTKGGSRCFACGRNMERSGCP